MDAAAIGHFSLVVRGIAASGESAVRNVCGAGGRCALELAQSGAGRRRSGRRRASRWQVWIVGRSGAFLTLDANGSFSRVDFPTTQHLTGIGYANGRFVVSATYQDVAPARSSHRSGLRRTVSVDAGTTTVADGLNLNFVVFAAEKWLVGSIGGALLTPPTIGVGAPNQRPGHADSISGVRERHLGRGRCQRQIISSQTPCAGPSAPAA